MSSNGIDLEGKSQLMIDFLEIKEQTNDYRTNILELLENDNKDSQIEHYSQMVQYLNQYGMLTEHALQRMEEQIQTIQELNGWKCLTEEQMNQFKTRNQSLENDCANYEKRLNNTQQEVAQGEQDLKNCQNDLRTANEAIRNYQVKCNDLENEIERLEIKVKQNNGEHEQKIAQSSIDLQVLDKQIQDYKELELEKVKEINELKQMNLQWEQKTKEILYEIQQNDLMLEKKELERNGQIEEMYAMINHQEEEIERLTKQLQHQARKEQAALAHSKLNLAKSIVGGSFVGVSGGQSFVIPNAAPLVSPNKLQRVNSSDKLTDQESKNQESVISPENLGGIENEVQEMDSGLKSTNKDDIINVHTIKADTNSMPGSFTAGEAMLDNGTPVVCADDGFRSQQSEEELEEVNVELVEEQGKGEVVVVEEDEEKAAPLAASKKPLGAPLTLRRDPEEEYFMLAILALKMQHTENHEAEFIYQIDSAKLFEQVKQIKLPFHKWYSWLDTKFSMMKVAFEQEQEDLYNDPKKNPDGLVNPYKRTENESTKSSIKTADAEPSPFGIFDKIKNFLNRQTSEEQEEAERKEKERKERQTLLQGNGIGLKQNFQYKTMRSKNFTTQFQKPMLSTKSEEIFALGQPFNMKRNFFAGVNGGSSSNGTILSANSDTMTTKWNFIDA